MRKPVSVWITQIIACLYVIMPAIALYRLLQFFMTMLGTGAMEWKSLLGVGFFALVITLLIVMVIQLQRRSPVGRWLAVTLIVFLFAMGISTLPHIPASGADARWWGFLSAVVAIFALLGWWLYAIGFSRGARAWFTKTAHVADPSAPR